MKILELFSGYGTASFALKRLQMDYELVGYSDIDKYANHCFKQNHCPDDTDDKLRLNDVTKVDEKTLPDFDLLTGGFPCQAFSVAGQMKGELDPRGTLFNEIIRIAEHKQPKYMLLENVKGLTSKKFKDTFDKILSELDRIGYDVHWKVLNSKEHGIPQSRARVWFVCFRKDLGRTSFQFPEPVELKIFIKDILEPQVDSKYYLSEKLQERFAKYLEEKNRKLSQSEPAILDLYNKKVKDDGTCITLSDPCHNNLRLIEGDKESKICAMRGRNPEKPTSRVSGLPTEQMIEFQKEPISNTLSTVQKDNLVYDNHRKGEIREYENVSYTLSQAMGTGGNNVPMIMDYRADEGFRVRDVVSPTLTSHGNSSGGIPVPMVAISNCSARECGFQSECSPTLCARDYKDPKIVMNKITQAVGRYGHSREELEYINNVGKLRRLTPTECFRLMGFLNDEIQLEGLSDTQKYKLAGNGQDVNMVTLLFERMLNGN